MATTINSATTPAAISTLGDARRADPRVRTGGGGVLAAWRLRLLAF
jgi:hypothetical protein